MATEDSLITGMLGSYVDVNEQAETSYLAVDSRTPKTPAYLCPPRLILTKPLFFH